MPSHPIIHEVIEKSNIPLAAPSANISTKPSGTCVEDIKEDFEGKIDLSVWAVKIIFKRFLVIFFLV